MIQGREDGWREVRGEVRSERADRSKASAPRSEEERTVTSNEC
jgi:hypothetical protein